MGRLQSSAGGATETQQRCEYFVLSAELYRCILAEGHAGDHLIEIHPAQGTQQVRFPRKKEETQE